MLLIRLRINTSPRAQGLSLTAQDTAPRLADLAALAGMTDTSAMKAICL
jgi:hypothetical protein